MSSLKIIGIEELKKAVRESINEIENEFPNLFFGYAGLIPENDQENRYNCTPLNTKIFAGTGGNGVHFSVLEISEGIQPIVMSVPMNLGNVLSDYNKVIAENLNEFLSIGFYNGWSQLEDLCYDIEGVIDFYLSENMDKDFQNDADIHFVKKIREKLNFPHIALRKARLMELEQTYFDKLQFKPEFVEETTKSTL